MDFEIKKELYKLSQEKLKNLKAADFPTGKTLQIFYNGKKYGVTYPALNNGISLIEWSEYPSEYNG